MERLYRMIAMYMAGDNWGEMSREQKDFCQDMAEHLFFVWALGILSGLLTIGLFVSLFFTCKLYSEKIELQQQIQELQEKLPVIDNPIKIEDNSND